MEKYFKGPISYFPDYSILDIKRAIISYEWAERSDNPYYYLLNNPNVPLNVGKEMYS